MARPALLANFDGFKTDLVYLSIGACRFGGLATVLEIFRPDTPRGDFRWCQS